MDHAGVLARTVADAALVADVCRTAGAPVAAAAGAPVVGLRLGVPQAAFDGADPEVSALTRAAVERLAALGLAVVTARRPSSGDLDLASAAGLFVSRSEAAAFHRWLDTDRARYWDEVSDQLNAASGLSAIDYLDAQRCRAALGHDLLAVFDDIDVLATPTTLVPAPPAGDFVRYLTLLARNVIPWSLLGFPALSLPVGLTPDGLPAGLQLVAPPHRDHLVIATAAALEHAPPPGT
jgi:aspartyl-tRNA(Asn)/glutamyl-tRNA(Gln) amidotransferase subunit A